MALIKNTRQNTAKNLKTKYDKELAAIREQFEETIKEMRLELKSLRTGEGKTHVSIEHKVDELASQKQHAKAQIATYQRTISDLNKHEKNLKLPGKTVEFSDLNVGDLVFIIPLGQQGKVVKINANQNEKIEIEAGLLSLKADFKDLRKMTCAKQKAGATPSSNRASKKKSKPRLNPKDSPELLIQTSTNTIDLRGCLLDEALKKTWRFLDAAVLRGEKQIFVIHGHGSDSLKQGIRNALELERPYELKYQPGDRYCGGDGVTVVYFED